MMIIGNSKYPLASESLTTCTVCAYPSKWLTPACFSIGYNYSGVADKLEANVYNSQRKGKILTITIPGVTPGIWVNFP